MKVGSDAADTLKKQSELQQIPFANLLWIYMAEDMMQRFYQSSYKEILWLENDEFLEEREDLTRAERQIRFLYKQSERSWPEEKLVPGQKLSIPMMAHLIEEVFGEKNVQQIRWRWDIAQKSADYEVHLTGNYKEMEVPFVLGFHTITTENIHPVSRERKYLAIKGKGISYLTYSLESQISLDLYEIMAKLELIQDMGCYYRTYEILCTQSLSGRYVIDELQRLTEKQIKVRKETRIAQIAGYAEYGYMCKRWERYLRSQGATAVPWAEALARILTFLEPLWHCLCTNEIFFDDWMPELGRFLG